MSSYGFLLDEHIKPQKQEIYKIFVSYFGNPLMTKVSGENKEGTYIAQAKFLLREKRYLIVNVSNDTANIGSHFPLADIQWDLLQTRKSSNQDFPCLEFEYFSSGKSPFNSLLKLKERNTDMSIYEAQDMNLTACLLHTGESMYQYPSEGTIASFLETYQTIFKMENKP